MRIKVSDYIFGHLVKNACIDTVFMLPGGACGEVCTHASSLR